MRMNRRKKEDSNFTTGIVVVLLHFQIGPSLYVIPNQVLQEFKETPTITTSFQR